MTLLLLLFFFFSPSGAAFPRGTETSQQEHGATGAREGGGEHVPAPAPALLIAAPLPVPTRDARRRADPAFPTSPVFIPRLTGKPHALLFRFFGVLGGRVSDLLPRAHAAINCCALSRCFLQMVNLDSSTRHATQGRIPNNPSRRNEIKVAALPGATKTLPPSLYQTEWVWADFTVGQRSSVLRNTGESGGFWGAG